MDIVLLRLQAAFRTTVALTLAALLLAGCSSEIVGTFGTEWDEASQRGCSFVDTDEGERYEITLPEGWSGDFEDGTLTDQNGVAQIAAGDRVVVRGNVRETGTDASDGSNATNPCNERGDPVFTVNEITIAD